MSDYTKHLARQLGIRESSIKPVDMDATEVDPDELKMGMEDETEHTNDPDLAKKIALHHLKKHGDYYSKLSSAGLDEKLPAAIDRIMSPTAIQTPIIGMAVRGSSTGGFPSGIDQTGIASKTPTGRLGGYEPISTAKQNSELVDKTPSNSTINSETPIATDVEADNVADSHPHQTQNNTDEPPQAVTGASEDNDTTLTLKSMVPKEFGEGEDEDNNSNNPDFQEKDRDQFRKDRSASSEGDETRKELGLNETRVSINVLDEVRKKLSEKAAAGKMNAKEAELFSTITEVMAHRGLGLEQKLFGKKSMLETANVKKDGKPSKDAIDSKIDARISALKKEKDAEQAKWDDKKNQDKLEKQIRRDDLA